MKTLSRYLRFRFLERSTNRTNIFKNILLWLILFSCLFILVCPLALHLSYVLPAIKPRTIPLHEFSEERARDYYSNLTQYGPRVINTNADYQTRQFLLSELHRMRSLTRKTIRFEISLQNFTVKHIENLQNIAVRLSDVNSPDDTSCLMLTAHYDSGMKDFLNFKTALFFFSSEQLNLVLVVVMMVQALLFFSNFFQISFMIHKYRLLV